MTEEEILTYNKMCAEFLGLKSNTNQQYLLPLRQGWYGGNSYREWADSDTYIDDTVFEGYKENCWALYTTELEFHYNWNWIQEVVNAIEESGYYIITYKKTVKISNSLGDVLNMDNSYFIVDVDGLSKKDALVKAINQFLL